MLILVFELFINIFIIFVFATNPVFWICFTWLSLKYMTIDYLKIIYMYLKFTKTTLLQRYLPFHNYIYFSLRRITNADSLHCLRHSMPNLQAIELLGPAGDWANTIPAFPWSDEPMALPWGLSRTQFLHDHYATSVGIRLSNNLYRYTSTDIATGASKGESWFSYYEGKPIWCLLMWDIRYHLFCCSLFFDSMINW